MIDFPNAKINLGLYITEKRTDGYHTIRTVMIPVQLTDILEFTENDKDELHCSGLSTGSVTDENLVMKALNLLRTNYEIPPLSIWLHKAIPTGAGLGGGSSDAAFMLKMLNSFYSLGLTATQMREFALMIGSDCAFFIGNQPALATGRGEILSPLEAGVEDLYIAVVNPGLHVSTKEAYAGIIPSQPEEDIRHIISLPVAEWPGRLENQFENTVFKVHPQIRSLKDQLYRAGAVYASMSGSGASVFGLFREEPEISLIPAEMVIYLGRMG
jgi:4-diphosphocytidyl-2-C-methyl-D-erythritol kinase